MSDLSKFSKTYFNKTTFLKIVSETRTGEFGTNFYTPDAYMGFRTAFSCSNLEQMILHFEMNNEPFMLLNDRMYVKTPSGKIFEIFEE